MADDRRPRVLVIDDEPDVRELLADAIRSFDFNVQVDLAASGTEALQHAADTPPDIVVTDMYLGDCTGLDVLEGLGDEPAGPSAVVITGHSDPTTFTQASRCRPVEVMRKPLDLARLQQTLQAELDRRRQRLRQRRRTHQLRTLARQTNLDRKAAHRKLRETCQDLSQAYAQLGGQMAVQQLVLGYQQEMIAARTDDDVFRSLFRTFVQRSGALFGVALVCDADAELQMVGRFGVPYPDESTFCHRLVGPAVAQILSHPALLHMDAGEEAELFDPSIRRYLPGLSLLAVPLLPAAGQLIGLVVFYRKGEQPFTPDDRRLAEVLSLPTALAVHRTD